MLEFIQDLKEARMFRGAGGLRGQSAHQLGKTLYVALLALELARKIDEYAVRNYAVKTLQFGDFDSMRMGTTDVANLVCILNNQSEYEEKIQVDFDVSAPMLQINSYMQNLKQRYFSSGMVRQFFLNLEAMLQINDSTLWSVRRTVIDWRRATDMEKRMAIDNIRREIHRHSLLLDIVELLPNM